MTTPDVHKTIRAIYRIESPKLVASLTRLLRDLGLAEEYAQDALVAAIEQWPTSGIPERPAAWLMATAKNRALNHVNRRKMLERKHGEIRYEAEAEELRSGQDFEAAIDEEVEDDRLRLLFTSCHPVLSTEARVALTLRVLGGLTTEEIARAFLVEETTMAQRIVRAKRALADAQVPFEVPRGPDLRARLTSVLEVVYLVFNEGYTASAGEDWIRPALCDDALQLGRSLAALAPEEPEVHGLLALMELNASRLPARVGPSGEPVLLLEQDRSRWDRLLIQRGLAGLERVERLGGAGGSYALQAAIAACHARAFPAERTDWPRIAHLYAQLAELTGSPIVELNRAVAVGMAFGPEPALAILDELLGEPALKTYPHFPSVRAEFLSKLGRLKEARKEYERAAALTQNVRERELLLARASACG